MSKLKLLQVVIATGFIALASLVSATSYADTLLVSKNVMVTSPSVPNVDTLVLTSAGTLTMSVRDQVFPELLQSLSFAITDDHGVLQRLNSAGSFAYKTSGPMTLFAEVYAQPNAATGVGAYHVDVSFVLAVPLPASVWQLIIAITSLSLAIVRRKRVTVTDTAVQAAPTSMLALARRRMMEISLLPLSILRGKRATVTNTVVQYV